MPNPTQQLANTRQRLIGVAIFCIAIFSIQYSALAISQSDALETEFVRYVPALDPWQGELQTAVVSFRNKQGVTVDLVAAVHIADTEYYQQLNEYFATRDLVLYELVAEPGEVPTAAAATSNRSALGIVQQLLANFLRLSFQLDEIDYSAMNFLHADLTPTQLQQIMQSKNENFLSMFVSLALAQSAELQTADSKGFNPSALNMMTIISALNAENQNDALKSLLAQELGRSGGAIVAPALESQLTILGDRNAVVLETLKNSLLEPQFKAISIFFGAAHMVGIERVLTTEMGFERVAASWRAAWTIP